MAKDIEVDININSNTEATIANLKALKRQLKETAAGSEEFNRISQQIRDMDDAIKDASKTSDDFLGYLENASGPLGILGRGIRQAEQTFSSFNAVLKASVIGILVAAIGGLVAAFSQSETAMKKLQPLFIGMEKILGGIYKVFEPLLDAFIDLALKALPYITKGIGTFYSGLFALFTLIKNVGAGAGNILKGIFTLDFDSIKEGYNQLTGSWNAAVAEFKEANKRFEIGSNELTKTEKANATKRVEIRKTEKKEKEKVIDAELASMREFQGEYENYLKKLTDLQNQYNTEIEDLQAISEQQKLDLWYKRRAEEIEAITKDAGEKNDLYALLETERAIKQAEIEKKKEDELTKIRQEGEDARLAYEKEVAQKEQDIRDARLAAQLGFVDASRGAINALGALFEQGTDAAKVAALADIAIGTATGFIQALDIAQKSAKATGPAAAFAFPIFYASQVAAVLGAASRASAVLSSGNTSAATESSAPSVMAPTFNVVGTSPASANQIALSTQSQAPLKAYVVSSDVTTQQALDRNIVKSASLG